MPLYTYDCECGETVREFNRIADRDTLAPFHCRKRMNRRFEPPQIQAQILGGGDLQGYLCPVTNEWVTSRTRRREIMKENDLIEAGDKTSSKDYRENKMLTATNGSRVAD